MAEIIIECEGGNVIAFLVIVLFVLSAVGWWSGVAYGWSKGWDDCKETFTPPDAEGE